MHAIVWSTPQVNQRCFFGCLRAEVELVVHRTLPILDAVDVMGGVVPSRRILQVRTYICTVTYCTLQLHGGRTALRPDGFRSLSCAKLRAAGDEHGEASAEKVGGILPQSWTLMTDGIELVP
jgi:hypothetical protein